MNGGERQRRQKHQLPYWNRFIVHSKHSTTVLLDILHLTLACCGWQNQIFQYFQLQYCGGNTRKLGE